MAEHGGLQHSGSDEVMWLNPLKQGLRISRWRGDGRGSPGVDVFVGGHTLSSLEDVAALLAESLTTPA
ncbi:hypothetical protein [Pseudonocardia sp. H11422]|uniref:hypothetical protein n=1 Tax=Pseudonocardia sp. H11422 TaxID=2835866 RepID=UPI001BDBF338|nr:hypothetical protein [Pseudonocardia sp. H11422]